MATKQALARAEESITATLAQSDQILRLADGDGRAAQKDLLSVLEAADAEVAKRLAKISPKPNGDMKFTAAQAIAYRAQIAVVIEKVKYKLDPVATDVAEAAMQKSVKQGASLLAKLEQSFKGVSTSPNILAAMQQSQVVRGPNASLVTRVATSLDRYGYEMGGQFSRILQVGLLSGATQDQMVATLVGHGGPKGKVSLAAKEVAPGVVQRVREGDIPEGLFVRHRYWAERIVRTELAYAFNGVKLEQMRTMRAEGLEVKKKIVAHFDSRTAPDSVAVHGQVRELEQSFLDGAGRSYLQPPGRPNDRETIIPWFGDWEETPSTKAPNPEEVAKAEELAQPAPAPKGAPLVPRSTEELHQLEQEARGAVELERARQEARAHQELANLGDDVQHAETLAAKVLERIEQETKAKQHALQKLAEEQAKKAAKAAEKKAAKAIKATDASVGTKALKGEAHLAHLELIQLSWEKPEHFAEFVNMTKLDDKLPIASITGAVKVSPPVTEQLIKDALSGYNDAAGNPVANALAEFKKSDKYPAFVDELAKGKSAKAQKLFAALIASEGELYDKALSMAKGLPKLTAKQLKAKYKPAPPPVPLAPPPVAKDYVFKSGGSSYIDVYEGEKKVALFFEKTPGVYTVEPPPKLASHQAKTFSTKEEAAVYAVEVSKAIQALPPAPKPAAAAYSYSSEPKTSRFNHAPEKVPTVLKPIKIAAGAQKDIDKHRKTARAHFAKHGVVKVKEDRASIRGGVDQVLEKAELWHQQKKWSDGIGGCWYSSSAGAKSMAGKLVAHDLSPDHGEGKQVAEDMAKQVDDERSKGDHEKYFHYSRLKYAATQEAIEIRRKAGEFAEHIDDEGYVLLYRGIRDDQAAHLRKARELGEHTEVAFRTVSSWSVLRGTAVRFATSSGVVIRARVHISRIFSQFEQERIAMDRFGHGESEWIVINEDHKGTQTIKSEDVQNPHNE